MVSEKMGLPFYRGGRGRRTGHNINFLGKLLFLIIYCGKPIQSIFIKFSVFVYRYQQSFLTCHYIFIVDAGKKIKNGLRLGASIVLNQKLKYSGHWGKNWAAALASALIYIIYIYIHKDKGSLVI